MQIKIENKPYDVVNIYEGSVIIDNIPCCFELVSSTFELRIDWLEELPENIDKDKLEDKIIEQYKVDFYK